MEQRAKTVGDAHLQPLSEPRFRGGGSLFHRGGECQSLGGSFLAWQRIKLDAEGVQSRGRIGCNILRIGGEKRNKTSLDAEFPDLRCDKGLSFRIATSFDTLQMLDCLRAEGGGVGA